MTTCACAGCTCRSRVSALCYYSHLNNISKSHQYLLQYKNPLLQFIFISLGFFFFVSIGLVSFLQNKYFKEVFLVIILLVGATPSVNGY